MLENNHQKRAQHAFAKVNEMDNLSDDKLKHKYYTVAKNAPEMIHQCGVLQCFAFYLSKISQEEKKKKKKKKEDNEYDYLLKHVFSYTEKVTDWSNNIACGLYRKLLKKSPLEIMQYTQEVQLLLSWFKRFSTRLKDDE